MPTLHILYKDNIQAALEQPLHIRIDEGLRLDIEKGKSAGIELGPGLHTVRMFVPGRKAPVGYADARISLSDGEEAYYVYDTPVILTNDMRGHFTEVDKEDFEHKETAKSISRNLFAVIFAFALMIVILILKRLLP